MRRILLAGMLALVPGLGWAQSQSAPITATPLMPPTVQYPPQQPGNGQPQVVQPQVVQPAAGGQPPSDLSPPLQPAPLPSQAPSLPNQPQPSQIPPSLPAQPPPGQTPQGQAPAPTQPLPAVQQPAVPGQPPAPEQPPPPNPWLPQGGAVLQVLDKVNAQTATLTVKVGQSAAYQSLNIAVKACDIRPPDMPADAAADLVITDSHPDQPSFQGWMLRAEPSVSMLQHPLYDVRVIGCTP